MKLSSLSANSLIFFLSVVFPTLALGKAAVTPAELATYAQENSQLSKRCKALSQQMDILEAQFSALRANIDSTNTRIMYARNALIMCAVVAAAWLAVEGVHYYFKHRKKPNLKTSSKL